MIERVVLVVVVVFIVVEIVVVEVVVISRLVGFARFPARVREGRAFIIFEETVVESLFEFARFSKASRSAFPRHGSPSWAYWGDNTFDFVSHTSCLISARFGATEHLIFGGNL